MVTLKPQLLKQALIVCGDEKRFYEEAQEAVHAFANDGFDVFVACPNTLDRATQQRGWSESDVLASIADIHQRAEAHNGPHHFAAMITLHGSQHAGKGSFCVKDGCNAHSIPAALDNIPADQREFYLGNCYAGNFIDQFLDDPNTMLQAGGSRGEVQFGMRKLFSNKVKDLDGNRRISPEERFVYAEKHNRNPFPQCLTSAGYQFQGKPPFDNTVHTVTTIEELNTWIDQLRGCHFIALNIVDEAKLACHTTNSECAEDPIAFAEQAQHAAGQHLFLQTSSTTIASHYNVETTQPNTLLINHRGEAMQVQDRHGVIAAIASFEVPLATRMQVLEQRLGETKYRKQSHYNSAILLSQLGSLANTKKWIDPLPEYGGHPYFYAITSYLIAEQNLLELRPAQMVFKYADDPQLRARAIIAAREYVCHYHPTNNPAKSGRHHFEAALSLVGQGLQDSSPLVRSTSIESLTKLAIFRKQNNLNTVRDPVHLAFTHVQEVFSDQSAEVRAAGIQALTTLHEYASHPRKFINKALVASLLTDESADVRGEAALYIATTELSGFSEAETHTIVNILTTDFLSSFPTRQVVANTAIQKILPDVSDDIRAALATQLREAFIVGNADERHRIGTLYQEVAKQLSTAQATAESISWIHHFGEPADLNPRPRAQHPLSTTTRNDTVSLRMFVDIDNKWLRATSDILRGYAAVAPHADTTVLREQLTARLHRGTDNERLHAAIAFTHLMAQTIDAPMQQAARIQTTSDILPMLDDDLAQIQNWGIELISWLNQWDQHDTTQQGALASTLLERALNGPDPVAENAARTYNFVLLPKLSEAQVRNHAQQILHAIHPDEPTDKLERLLNLYFKILGYAPACEHNVEQTLAQVSPYLDHGDYSLRRSAADIYNVCTPYLTPATADAEWKKIFQHIKEAKPGVPTDAYWKALQKLPVSKQHVLHAAESITLQILHYVATDNDDLWHAESAYMKLASRFAASYARSRMKFWRAHLPGPRIEGSPLGNIYASLAVHANARFAWSEARALLSLRDRSTTTGRDEYAIALQIALDALAERLSSQQVATFVSTVWPDLAAANSTLQKNTRACIFALMHYLDPDDYLATFQHVVRLPHFDEQGNRTPAHHVFDRMMSALDTRGHQISAPTIRKHADHSNEVARFIAAGAMKRYSSYYRKEDLWLALQETYRRIVEQRTAAGTKINGYEKKTWVEVYESLLRQLDPGLMQQAIKQMDDSIYGLDEAHRSAARKFLTSLMPLVPVDIIDNTLKPIRERVNQSGDWVDAALYVAALQYMSYPKLTTEVEWLQGNCANFDDKTLDIRNVRDIMQERGVDGEALCAHIIPKQSQYSSIVIPRLHDLKL